MKPATNESESPIAPPPYAELVSPSQTFFPGETDSTVWRQSVYHFISVII